MPDRSRLGDLLLDMRLVDQETLQSALQEQRATHKRLPTILAERRVLDEERLTKAVAARLGLESVTLASHKVHERVLGLIPYAVAKRYGLLPIAVKRTQQAEVLYLVMVDPLNTEALGEVQRLTGRQVRVLMASATELDHCIDRHYQGLAQSPARTPLPRPTPAAAAPAAPGPATPTPPPRTPPRRAASVPGAPRTRLPSALRSPPMPPLPSGTPLPRAELSLEPAGGGGPVRRGLEVPDLDVPPGGARRPPEPPPPARLPRAEYPDVSGPGGPLGASQPPGPRPRTEYPDLSPQGGPLGPSGRPARAEYPDVSPQGGALASGPPARRPPEPPRATRASDTNLRPPIRPDGGLPMETRPPRSSEVGPARVLPPASRTGASPSRGTPVPPGRPPVLGPEPGRPTPVRPAPFPADARFDLANPATLIDTARPPELLELQAQLGGAAPEPRPPGALGPGQGLDPASGLPPVMPSDLDPPDAVSTRVEEDLAARHAQANLRGQDWDLAMPDWDVPSWASLGSPAAVAPEGAGDGPFHRADEVTNLDESWLMDAPARPAEGARPPRSTGPEDIATSQLELDDERPGLWGDVPPPPSPSAPPRPRARALAATLEVPMDFDEVQNPFMEGPELGDIPVGLERTAIIPAIDFEAEPFEPPPVAGLDPDHALVGGSDIPMSQAAVKARFGPPPGPPTPSGPPAPPAVVAPPPLGDEDAIEAIEEVMLEPLEEEPVDLMEVVDSGLPDLPPEDEVFGLGGEHDSDAQSMPVIEPSSLISLMDDPGEVEDTGADLIPRTAAPPPPPPATRLFDEATRRPGVVPRHASETEEPTNPRFAAPLEALGPPPEEVQATEAAVPVAAAALAPAPTPEPRPDTPGAEDPTPARDTLDRAEVLSALDGAFVAEAPVLAVPPAVPPAPKTPAPRPVALEVPPEAPRPAPVPRTPKPELRGATTVDRAVPVGADLVEALLAGSSLSSAGRAQLLLALGRVLIEKGILTREELAQALADAP